VPPPKINLQFRNEQIRELREIIETPASTESDTRDDADEAVCVTRTRISNTKAANVRREF
jgi:hypothetical protein